MGSCSSKLSYSELEILYEIVPSEIGRMLDLFKGIRRGKYPNIKDMIPSFENEGTRKILSEFTFSKGESSNDALIELEFKNEWYNCPTIFELKLGIKYAVYTGDTNKRVFKKIVRSIVPSVSSDPSGQMEDVLSVYKNFIYEILSSGRSVAEKCSSIVFIELLKESFDKRDMKSVKFFTDIYIHLYPSSESDITSVLKNIVYIAISKDIEEVMPCFTKLKLVKVKHLIFANAKGSKKCLKYLRSLVWS